MIHSFQTGTDDLHHQHALGVCHLRRVFPGIAPFEKPYISWYTPRTQDAAEGQNALAFYLSGLSDRAVARQVFTEKTLLNAIKLTKEKVKTYEHYDALTSQVTR